MSYTIFRPRDVAPDVGAPRSVQVFHQDAASFDPADFDTWMGAAARAAILGCDPDDPDVSTPEAWAAAWAADTDGAPMDPETGRYAEATAAAGLELGGWYWWPCLPGCLPDGGPDGPYPDPDAAEAAAAGWDGAETVASVARWIDRWGTVGDAFEPRPWWSDDPTGTRDDDPPDGAFVVARWWRVRAAVGPFDGVVLHRRHVYVPPGEPIYEHPPGGWHVVMTADLPRALPCPWHYPGDDPDGCRECGGAGTVPAGGWRIAVYLRAEAVAGGAR